MTKLQALRKHLRPGRVYRRADLAQWSNSVDRHVRQLLSDGTLMKLAGGLYVCPKGTAFGKAPPEDSKLVESFLKDKRYLLVSPNAYNQLKMGTTQLYDKTIVYNHKRRGCFALGGRTFDFRVKAAFPTKLSKEFLLVDLVNNLDQLAENREQVLARVKHQVFSYNRTRLKLCTCAYGNVRAKKFFAQALVPSMVPHVA